MLTIILFVCVLWTPSTLGSLENSHIHPEIPLVELKQHRHDMDQLEPDLAQNIFDGVQRNPLARTTTIPPKTVKSPSLRGKRGAILPIVTPAEIHVMEESEKKFGPDTKIENLAEYDDLRDDILADEKVEDILSEALNQTVIIEESINLGSDNSSDTVIDQIQETSGGPEADFTEVEKDTVIAGILTASSFDGGELDDNSTSVAPPNTLTTISDNSTVDLENLAEISTTPAEIDGLVLQEVATTTPKYNFTQNDNLPTADLDRKLLAFEINAHNKQLAQEILGGPVNTPERGPGGGEADSEIVEETAEVEIQESLDDNLEETETEEALREAANIESDFLLPPPEIEAELKNDEKHLENDQKLHENVEKTPVLNKFEQQHLWNRQSKILDSTVHRRRHLISNYIEPRTLTQREKESFFRSAILRHKRQAADDITAPSEMEKKAEPEALEMIGLPPLDVPDLVIAVEEETATIPSTTSSTPPSTESEIFPTLIMSSTLPSTSPETTPTTTSSTPSTTSPSTTTSTPPTTTVRHVISNVVKKTTPTPTTTEAPSTTTETPTTTTTVPLPESRQERLMLIHQQSFRRAGSVQGNVKRSKPEISTVQGTVRDLDAEVNPWKNNPYKTHIQLKLTADSSREVVERHTLSILPKLVPKNAKKAEPEPESIEFRDLPEAEDKDAIRQDSTVAKKISGEKKIIQPRPIFKQPQVPVQVQPQAPQPQPQQQQLLQRPPPLPQSFQQQQQPQFAPQQQPQFVPPQPQFQPPQPPQQFFLQQPQTPSAQFQQPQIPVTMHRFTINGQSFFVRSVPDTVFQQPQQQFQPFPPPQPQPSRSAPVSPPGVAPAILQTPRSPPKRPVHLGTARQSSPAPPKLGQPVRPEELNIVRIFQHRGTTKQALLRAMSTQPVTTTERPRPSTTERPRRVPVMFTTHPTPTTPLDRFLVTTSKPKPKTHVKFVDFDLYDEVDTTTKKTKTTTTTKRPTTTSTTTAPILEIKKMEFKLVGRDTPDVDYLTDEELASPKVVKPFKSPKINLRLVKLTNYVDADAAKREPARDFTGDAPQAKTASRSFVEKLITLG